MNPFKKTKKQLSIFVTAGYPQLNSLRGQIELLEKHQVDFIEVGIPFSDPLADGPVIQETSMAALKNGMNLELLFSQLVNRSSQTPIVLMGYLNPVLHYGLDRFLQNCLGTNVSSVILPDLSVEIYQRFYQQTFEKYGICPSFLITPKTEDDRIRKIATLCKNSFVYLVSTNATTGGQSKFDEQSLERYHQIKTICGETPLFIGFGIRTYEDVQRVQQAADGAIIGSAYLKALQAEKQAEFLNEILPDSKIICESL